MAATETATRGARALDDLYRAHVGEVYRYAYAVLGNHADAEDVTQTTFVNALRALERGERPRKPSNWLITIAHNVVRQRFRTQKSRPVEVELDRDVAVEEQAHEGPTLDELVKGLQRIPPTQREVLVMRELEGRSYREIQQILDLTPAALEMLLFRARRSLAEELENVVTCELAERAISKRVDGRLSRKERRRLLEHLAACPSCARLDAGQKKRRRAFGALAVLPLPLTLTFFKGAPSASAATGLPTIGTGELTVAGGGSAGTGGGLLASGVAFKAVALAAAVTVVGAVGYVGVDRVGDRGPARPPAAPSAVTGTPAAGQADPAPANHTSEPAVRRKVRTAADKPRVTIPGAARIAPKAVAPTPTAAGAGDVQAQPSSAPRAEAHATAAGTGDAVADAAANAVETPEGPAAAKTTPPVKPQAVPAQAAPAPGPQPNDRAPAPQPSGNDQAPPPQPQQNDVPTAAAPEQPDQAPTPEPEQSDPGLAPPQDGLPPVAEPEPSAPAMDDSGHAQGHRRNDDGRSRRRDDAAPPAATPSNGANGDLEHGGREHGDLEHGGREHGSQPVRTRHGWGDGR